MKHQELLAGLIRLHVLHLAVESEIYGQWMIEELARHGYRIGPGTLYPLLHGLEKKGYLKSRQKRSGGRLRRLYRATRLGREALDVGRDKVRELFDEMLSGPRHEH